jgi:hypothetical protein
MQRNNKRLVSRLAILAALVSVCQVAAAALTPEKELQALLDFQCHGVKTLKQAEENQARMGNRYTDQHPVMECLKAKVAALKAAGK